ncbi:hypothetical protein N0V93_004974 [Gnomoniopsis smithogilvyi]|uniref:DUF7053 domain-containing protein n=1 Tax=Gnomoniopsis smithogilvyi TaxID=1191159 RepID=A0A9W8YS08_9PEZI|nr:hypothetical protein N0V93_004974 [Gnomoniopsis smithogilvyi]
MPTPLQYATEVKGVVTKDQAIAVFHDHDFFMEVDPNMMTFKADVEPQGGKLHDLPPEIQAVKTGDTRCYEVTDRVPGVALFSKLLPGLSTTTIYYQITNTKDGVFMFLQAPLGVTEERRWVAEDASGAGGGVGVRIVEYVTIFCSRLLYGTIKGQQDQNWKEVHTKYARKMGGEPGTQSAS